MDYKYIEQLLERYWDCETSTTEERILRAFFNQEKVPEHLQRFKTLFEYEQHQTEEILGSDFDERVLNAIKDESTSTTDTCVKARRLTFHYRLRPLFRAAAIVAVFLMVGGAIQHTFNRPTPPKGWDYNAANYRDTYRVPQEAFEASMGGIEEIQDLLRRSDSLSHKTTKK